MIIVQEVRFMFVFYYNSNFKLGFFLVRFDYVDPFQSCNQDFLSRVAEMHRLQTDTIDWERKKKLIKKKPKIGVNSNNNGNSSNINND